MINNESNLTGVDKEIYQYLNIDDPQSFLLFAGAGSGKTRTLVNVLQEIRDNDLNRFIQNGQRVAVITYTNAACEEIKHRLQYDPLFHISTIHSFIWDLIKPFSTDIKDWLRNKLTDDITTLESKLAKARKKDGITAIKNARSKESKQRRLDELDTITDFIYSPVSNRPGKGSLNHAEIIQIGAYFLTQYESMQKVLINRFPILLIDESQDTDKRLLESFIATQQANQRRFSLGLFGDMMQRIYSGGKEDLGSSLPSGWKSPAKIQNYRCPKRIISLINKIRQDTDGKQQEPKQDAILGHLKLFIIDSAEKDKSAIEARVRQQMANHTNDNNWILTNEIKTLTLEHAMAANRGEFSQFFMPLSKVDALKDAALNGASRDFKFITKQLLPLISAVENDDEFEIIQIMNRYSKLLSSSNSDFIEDPLEVLASADKAIAALKETIIKNPNLQLKEILLLIKKFELLVIPDKFYNHLSELPDSTEEPSEDALLVDKEYQALSEALDASIVHVKNYSKYVSEQLGFGTHQGVKGLEFERVMAILDDEEANGFLFSYEKLFGAKELSEKDQSNESDGIDSAITRTRRLLYVICSRAKNSLAVVAYTSDPSAVNEKALASNWFNSDEIIMM